MKYLAKIRPNIGLTAIPIMAPLFFSHSLHALEFNIGGIEGSFDSQLSVGSSWRVESQDPDLILKSNGADNFSNSDDGNRNYKNGDAFSQLFKGVHDLEFRYQNYGGFVRGKYWYDSALENNNVDYGHSPTASKGALTGSDLSYQKDQELDDSNFNELSKASGTALLDAFIYGEFDVLNMPLDLRLGRQVLSWGEGTFLRGGLNVVNPVDINAFVRPGAEVKEGLLPVNMAFANIGLSDSLSLETFYQLDFQETVIPGCGTYFATNDYAPEGCNSVSILDGTFSISRDDNGIRKAKDDGQFGVAFRYLSETLGNTEFGIYAMNVHNRNPIASGIKTTLSDAQLGGIAQTQAGAWIMANAADPTSPTAQEAQTAETVGRNAALSQKIATSRYYVEYPENIQITGLSFSTTVGSTALSGELSYTKDTPIQINGPMMIGTLVTGESTAPELVSTYLATAEGGNIDGYRSFDVSQIKVTAIQLLDRMLGASRMTFIGEAGYTFIHGFDESADAIKFGRDDVFGLFNPLDPENNQDDGFVTKASWGYRARLVAEYPNAFLGVNVQPTIAWSHDVDGYSPQPGGNFIEGQQSLGLTLKGTYLESYTGSLGYTRYMGGKYSVIKDHDFASFSLGMLF